MMESRRPVAFAHVRLLEMSATSFKAMDIYIHTLKFTIRTS